MKATGIVRKIDGLGRVVIPKEICRTLGINAGGSLEIYTEDEGSIILRKYDSTATVRDAIDHLENKILGSDIENRTEALNHVGWLKELIAEESEQ